MAFGIDDIAKWVNGLRRSFAGGESSGPNAIGNENIQAGIINPLKMGADISGVTAGYNAVEPNASNLDRALGLLALSGFMGGQEALMNYGDNIANTIGSTTRSVSNKVKSPLSNKYIYGVHFSPQSGLKELDAANAGKRWGDSLNGANYFFNIDNLDQSKLVAMDKWTRLYGKGKNPLNMYLVKAPRKGTFTDLNDFSGGSIDTLMSLIENNAPKITFPSNPDEAMSILKNLDWYSKYAFKAPGEMYTKSPVKVIKEMQVGHHLTPGDADYLKNLPGRFATEPVDKESYYNILESFNKKNPNANKHNKRWLELWRKEKIDEFNTKISQEDINALTRYRELAPDIAKYRQEIGDIKSVPKAPKKKYLK